MTRGRRPVALVLLAATLGLGGCDRVTGVAGAGGEAQPPVVVEQVAGSDVARLTLSDRAVERLGITTVPVASVGSASLEVPYSAVVYDPDGAAWVYTNPEPRTYVRAAITIASVEGDRVTLSAGPTPGTPVVTVGAPELVGAEAGISGEE
jgi:hypothetical protein